MAEVEERCTEVETFCPSPEAWRWNSATIAPHTASEAAKCQACGTEMRVGVPPAMAVGASGPAEAQSTRSDSAQSALGPVSPHGVISRWMARGLIAAISSGLRRAASLGLRDSMTKSAFATRALSVSASPGSFGSSARLRLPAA